MLHTKIGKAINLCVNNGIPFVAFQKPFDSQIYFFSNPSSLNNNFPYKNNTRLYINNFSPTDNSNIIYNELNATETLENCKYIKSSPKIIPWKESTPYSNYKHNVETIVSLLKKRGGKIVLSKTICGIHNKKNWALLTQEYFKSYPNTFRYIYYTQATGCWIGASPEILISKENNKNSIKTMALAGTRSNSLSGQPWDKKNIDEHSYVTEFIINSLISLGITPKIYPAESLNFGDLEHLCTRIEAPILNNIHPHKIATALSPTPALSGYPQNNALTDLALLESHPRYCYGGFIGLELQNEYIAHVNLRCAHFNSNSFCIYSGGGLTVDSNVDEEWIETEQKIKTLKLLFSSNDN